MIFDYDKLPFFIKVVIDDAGIDLNKWTLVDYNHESITVENRNGKRFYWRY